MSLTPVTPDRFLRLVRPVMLSLLWATLGSASPLPVMAAEAPLQSSYRLEKGQSKGNQKVPAFLLADELHGQTDEAIWAKGRVELRKASSLMWADELNYWPLDDLVEARGNVRYKQGGSEFSGSLLRRNLTDMTGVFEQPSYLIRREILRKTEDMTRAPGMIGTQFDVPDMRVSYGAGQAERISFLSENHLALKQATYSTCRPDGRDWYLRASEIDLDYDADNGASKDSTIFFKDAPVFYWPSFSFPLNNASRSGFLLPTFMASTENGPDLTIPYYFNLAPDYDLLLNTRIIGQRGTQLGTELRYLDHHYTGEARYEYLNDSKYGSGRQAYNLTHTHNLGKSVSAALQWNGVSDGEYLTDLSTRLVQTSQVLLPRQLTVNYAPSPWISTSSRYLSYQALKTDFIAPYALEPQLNLTARQPDYRGADIQLTGQFSNFTHVTNVQGQRFLAYPQVVLPYESPSLFVRPKFGLHARQYSLDTQGMGNGSESAVIPTFSLDSGMVFERETSLNGRNTVQTLEPRLYYVNIPYQDQSRMPIFDTGLADFNFAQIFSENRYLGHDRMNDANQLTGAVASRFIDAESGAERMKLLLGQRYYFRKQEVTLNSVYPNMPAETARTDNFSSVIAAFSGLVAYRTYLESAWEYSYNQEKTVRYSAGARYQPAFGKVLTASYRLNRDQATLANQIEQYDIAGQWPLSGRWYAVGRFNYSIPDARALETILGFEYNAGCWMGRVVAQKIETIQGNPNTILFLQLELNDFAQLGTNPLQLLRRSIPGYGKINEVGSGSLIQ